MKAEFPAAFQFLFDDARYKVAYGGRGSGKSWAFARALLILGAQRKLRILCARETMRSMADSVHKLLSDQIAELGLEGHYSIEKARITGANGTEFIFAGLKHNAAALKSYEAVDICWVEEAQSVSKSSWATLIPTIRAVGSEIWASYNPDLDTDATHRLFVHNPPPGAVVRKVNFDGNPWFPDVLRAEMEHCRETDPDAFSHVWLGCCISNLDGAIYANELRAADKDNRICRVPYDPSKPVHTFWDLGWGDLVCIWFAQAFPFEYRIIDYLDGSQRAIGHYVAELQKRSYVYGTDYLPWDGAKKDLGTGKSIEDHMRALGRKVQVVPQLRVADGIDAARTIFGQCWFDAEKCADGLQYLRRYRYGTIATLGTPTREPLHDDASHAADAFRTLAVGLRPPKKKEPRYETARHSSGAYGWMGALLLCAYMCVHVLRSITC